MNSRSIALLTPILAVSARLGIHAAETVRVSANSFQVRSLSVALILLLLKRLFCRGLVMELSAELLRN